MMMPRLTVGEAEARSEDLSSKFAKDILDGKAKNKPSFNVFNVLENMGFSKMVGKKAKAFAVSDKCIGCGQCASICPRGNITVENGKARIGTNCTQCLGCLQFCPQNAISIGSISEKREHYHNPNVQAADLSKATITI
jgi:ferredoxin